MSLIVNAFNFKLGNGITRQYRNLKKTTQMAGAIGLINFGFAADTASRKELLSTVVITLCTFKMVKLFEDELNKLYQVKPQYDEIVKRAKSIYRKTK